MKMIDPTFTMFWQVQAPPVQYCPNLEGQGKWLQLAVDVRNMDAAHIKLFGLKDLLGGPQLLLDKKT